MRLRYCCCVHGSPADYIVLRENPMFAMHGHDPRISRQGRRSRARRMTEKLTPEHFLPHVNKTVRVSGWHHTLTLARVDIRKLEEWERKVVQRQPFMLILRGPRGDVL